jgi:UDPglucose--hexose-1-phosphate uridylyltransferase
MPEIRHDPIQKRWVIISSDRGKRPMDFSSSRDCFPKDTRNSCPFCAGREDATPKEIYKEIDPKTGKWLVRVVPNKFPALGIEGELDRRGDGHYDRMNGIGAHEVVIESPDHDLGLADLSADHIYLVLKTYRERILDLQKDTRFRYILVFKNHGAAGGASLAHSHTQIMATPVTPRTVAEELKSAKQHFMLKERCIFCDIIAQELDDGSRIVKLDEDFLTCTPYASRFPFEMHVYPRKHSHDFSKTVDNKLKTLAYHLKEVLGRMNAALGSPAYNFLIHTCPCTDGRTRRPNYWDTLELDWHWHIEILPRITRVAGFEWGTGFYINPTQPEDAARFLREVDL